MKKGTLIVVFVIYYFTLFAQVRLPGIFGDHMVLQRSQGVPVWGWAAPDEKLVINFKKQVKETKADPNGKWKIILDPEPAGGPFTLAVYGKDSVVFHDVMIGEVWLCSGQSNMEFELVNVKNAAAEIQSANYPEIRHIKIARRISPSPREDIEPATWQVCDSSTAGGFTAVGYFFARELVKRLHVAVGLINSTWGGTMVETWTSRGALEKSPEFKSMITTLPNIDFDRVVVQKKEQLDQQIHILQQNIHDSLPESEWKNPSYNSQAWPKIGVNFIWENQQMGLKDLDGIVWYRKEIILDAEAVNHPIILYLGKIDDWDETYVNGILVGQMKNYAAQRMYQVPAGVFKAGKNIIAVRVTDTGGGGGLYGDSSAIQLKTALGIVPLGDQWSFRIASRSENTVVFGPNDYPCLLFNAMINPLIPFGIRGVLWYQGEENAKRAYQYRISFPLMINDWRQHWGEGNFPFYFVQLASFGADDGNSQKGSTWAELREAQTRTLSLPATGMAVITDIGESNDIHPKNKQDVGLRLAAIAFNNIYGTTMEYSGPVYDSMSVMGNKIVLNFSHTGSGLVVKTGSGLSGCTWDSTTQNSIDKTCSSIGGFEIAGSDRHFYPARAFIRRNQVIVFSEKVQVPVSVHFAWADDAKDANLFNREGFPAVPFRTDQWPGITDHLKYSVN